MANDLTMKTDWKYGTKGDVLKTLLQEREPIHLFTYRPWNPFTKAIGYFDGKDIHININKLPRLSNSDLVGLLLHEYAHYCGFTHGNNYKTEEKCLYSVPYYLSENVEKWL
jgi:predicted SprT family Zn-dependent metalloprotease